MCGRTTTARRVSCLSPPSPVPPPSSTVASQRCAATAAAGPLFDRASGSRMHDEDGHEYLDFFAGAGSLNYGHNNPAAGGADRLPGARTASPRPRHVADGQARVPGDLPGPRAAPARPAVQGQFPGPTGTNAVEAALKLARKVKGRTNVVAFTNAFHGMSLGSLAVTGNAFTRAGPASRWCTARRCRSTTTSHGLDRTSCGSSGCWRTGLAASTARRRDRRDGAGRGRHQRGPRRVAARAGRARASARHAAHRRRHPDGLRPHRGLLLLRGGGHRARHRHGVQVASAATACRCRCCSSPGAGRLGAGRAQRHLPRQQPRLRHRRAALEKFWSTTFQDDVRRRAAAGDRRCRTSPGWCRGPGSRAAG